MGLPNPYKLEKLIIQAYNAQHPVIKEVLAGDLAAFFRREITERRNFGYVPFTRLIRITLRHKKPQTVNDAMQLYAHWLKKELGEAVIGPAVPQIGRIRTYYLLDLLIKLERKPKALQHAKRVIRQANAQIVTKDGYSGLRIAVDVDP